MKYIYHKQWVWQFNSAPISLCCMNSVEALESVSSCEMYYV